MKTLLCTLVLATLATASAHASPVTDVTITFDKPSQTAAAGSTIQYFGTIVNNTNSTLFLNGDDLNTLGLSISTNDLFLTNAPISLAPSGQAGSSSGDIELFDILISNPLLDATGNYAGVFDIVGGVDGNAQDVLGVAPFSVNTTSAVATGSVPEPSSILLVLTALSGVFFATARRTAKAAL